MAEHVCPWWVGYVLVSPLRRLLHSPVKILSPHVTSGMTVLDLGCAMGFFSLPLAEMVAPGGRVVCVDLQERMIRTLKKRADRAEVSDRIETRLCQARSLGLRDLSGRIDFALAFAVLHEVPDARTLLTEIGSLLRPGGRLLIAEPRGHVSRAAFETTLAAATEAGLSLRERPEVKRTHAALLERSPGSTA
jgi:2-polyprenyl-3-methyl-5-hydroxy-6-metoxy-1,4-benzoquinol methylase